jgi:GABA permease
MRNPFRSEAEAYRFLLLSVGYFALIVVAASIDTWLGLAVFVALTLGALAFWLRGRQAEPRVPTVVASHPEGERRILVVANETVGGEELFDVISRRAAEAEEHVLVVCPALNSAVKTWVSDEDEARRAARTRLDATLARLAAAGVDARGEVGDSDPLQSIDDAMRTFGADEIVISTHPEGRSHWLERGIVEATRERYDVPVSHVVVDLTRQ